MNPNLLIQAVVQQTTVFIAQLATSGGVRSPLSGVANQVFLDLSNELQNQGVKKNVIADMFGLTLRTFHRKVAELGQSQSVEGRSVWEAVLDYVRQSEPVSASQIFQRFSRDDRDVVGGVLNDLANTGLCYRAGRGNDAVYRFAQDVDFGPELAVQRAHAHEYLVWQAIYRHGPLDASRLEHLTRLSAQACEAAIQVLLSDQRVTLDPDTQHYSSARLDVPVGQAHGWEAAVLDHYQALVTAVCAKLAAGEGRADARDHTGGATYSLDLWPGHPLEAEMLGTLSRLRAELEDLRSRVDQVNAETPQAASERLLIYFGQTLRTDRSPKTLP